MIQQKVGKQLITTSPAPMPSVTISHPYLSSGQVFGQPPPPPVVGGTIVTVTGGGNGSGVGAPQQSTGTNNTGRGPFASALRNLAKQADIKEDDPGTIACNSNEQQQIRTNSNNAFTSSSAVASSSSGGVVVVAATAAGKRSASADDQMLDNRIQHDNVRDNLRKTPLSPQPPEKVNHFCFMWNFIFKTLK